MDTSQLDRPMSQAKVTKNLVTLACASLLAFNAFHFCKRYQSFRCYETAAESQTNQVEQFASTLYSFHPALILAKLVDEQSMRYFVAGKEEKLTECADTYLTLQKVAYGVRSPAICQALIRLGLSHIADKNFAAAEVAFKTSLEICQTNHLVCPSGNSPGVVGSLYWLSALYGVQKRYAEAEASDQQAISLLIDKSGNDSACGDQYRLLAELSKSQAKYESAILFYQKCLTLHGSLFGENDQDSVYLRGQIAHCRSLSMKNGRRI